MAKPRWYLRLTQRDGQVGLAITQDEWIDDRRELTALWPVDASGTTIAELLRDLASELEDAERDRR
jgi:hypothetical protein